MVIVGFGLMILGFIHAQYHPVIPAPTEDQFWQEQRQEVEWAKKDKLIIQSNLKKMKEFCGIDNVNEVIFGFPEDIHSYSCADYAKVNPSKGTIKIETIIATSSTPTFRAMTYEEKVRSMYPDMNCTFKVGCTKIVGRPGIQRIGAHRKVLLNSRNLCPAYLYKEI